MLSNQTGRPARFVRKAAKPYGTQRLAEGGPVDGLRLVVVEDVITSGDRSSDPPGNSGNATVSSGRQ